MNLCLIHPTNGLRFTVQGKQREENMNHVVYCFFEQNSGKKARFGLACFYGHLNRLPNNLITNQLNKKTKTLKCQQEDLLLATTAALNLFKSMKRMKVVKGKRTRDTLDPMEHKVIQRNID